MSNHTQRETTAAPAAGAPAVLAGAGAGAAVAAPRERTGGGTHSCTATCTRLNVLVSLSTNGTDPAQERARGGQDALQSQNAITEGRCDSVDVSQT